MCNIKNSIFTVLFFLCTAFSAVVYPAVKDITMEGKAKMVMILKKGVPSANIKTNAYQGKLQIAGYVDNAEEFRQVENAITEYLKDGNNEIINSVKIYSAKSNLSDEFKLESKVINQFETKNFPVADITIQAKAGHVMLSGFMDKYFDVARASSIAKTVSGVSKVDNCLLHKEKINID